MERGREEGGTCEESEGVVVEHLHQQLQEEESGELSPPVEGGEGAMHGSFSSKPYSADGDSDAMACSEVVGSGGAVASFEVGGEHMSSFDLGGTVHSLEVGEGGVASSVTEGGSISSLQAGGAVEPSLEDDGGVGSSLEAGREGSLSSSAEGGLMPSVEAGGWLVPSLEVGGGLMPSLEVGGGLMHTMEAGGGLMPTLEVGAGLMPSTEEGGGFMPSTEVGGGRSPSLQADHDGLPSLKERGGDCHASPRLTLAKGSSQMSEHDSLSGNVSHPVILEISPPATAAGSEAMGWNLSPSLLDQRDVTITQPDVTVAPSGVAVAPSGETATLADMVTQEGPDQLVEIAAPPAPSTASEMEVFVSRSSEKEALRKQLELMEDLLPAAVDNDNFEEASRLQELVDELTDKMEKIE
ncbi:MAG: hypothetical protein SGPRY_002797 [Prymnesium sp.]